MFAELKYRATTSDICGAVFISLGVQYIEPSGRSILSHDSPFSNSACNHFDFVTANGLCCGRMDKINDLSKFFKSVMNSSLSLGLKQEIFQLGAAHTAMPPLPVFSSLMASSVT